MFVHKGFRLHNLIFRRCFCYLFSFLFILPTTKASFEATTLHTQVNEVLATPFHPVVDDTRFFDANAAASSSNASSSSSTSLSAEGPPTMFRSISNKVTTAFSSISNSSYVNQSSPPLPLPPPGLERAVSSARTVALDEKRRRLLASLEDYHGLDLLTSSTNGVHFFQGPYICTH